MKNLFLSFLAILSISTMTFAQDISNTAAAQTKTELAASKESGNYLFILPAGLSAETVAKNSTYYVHYFTVEYTEKTSEAKITMTSNDEKGRHVIMRFLTANGVRFVKVDGTTISTEDFFVKYIQ